MVATVLECECGFEARSEDEDGLVLEVQRHAREAHGMTLSADEARLVASRALSVASLRPGRDPGSGNEEKEET